MCAPREAKVTPPCAALPLNIKFRSLFSKKVVAAFAVAIFYSYVLGLDGRPTLYPSVFSLASPRSFTLSRYCPYKPL